MAKGELRLHPKFGVNPTVPVCAWCEKDKNEIAMLGAAYKGEAPRRMVVDDTPCETCQAVMAQGFTMIEMRSDAVGNKPTREARTGKWCVLSMEAAHRILGDNMKNYPKNVALVTPDVSEMMGLFQHEVPFNKDEATSEKARDDGKG